MYHKKHLKHQQLCEQLDRNPIQTKVQKVRYGGRIICFGVWDPVIGDAVNSYAMSFDEYMAAENEAIEFETIPRRYFDEIDSQLYRKYGWFRLNDDNSDFLDISRSMLVAMSEYELPEELQERLKLFFERSIESVHEFTPEYCALLADDHNYSIRPIRNQSKSYSNFFVQIIKFAFALVDLGFRDLVAEPFFSSLEFFVLEILNSEYNAFAFEHLQDIWKLIVNQKLPRSKNDDILRLHIRFRCFNAFDGKLAKASSIEQMAAKSFYFCRLFFLLNLRNSEISDQSFEHARNWLHNLILVARTRPVIECSF